MKINGQWVGWGLSDEDPKVADMKAFLVRKFAWVRDWVPALDLSPIYDATMTAVVGELQKRYGLPVTGVMNYTTQKQCGYLKDAPQQAKPVLFTVEGHLSNMFMGPCAETAKTLEAEGVCRWQPIGYDNVSLPFNNASGENELRRLLSDRVLLPPGTPWGMAIFSQGGIVGSKVFLEHVRPENGSLHWRYQDWVGTLAHGNPYRENNVIAEWVPDPPRPNTQGISNIRMTDTPAAWKEVARRGDLYAENTVDDAGEDKTAIYMAVQNQWSGHPNALLSQIVELIQRPVPETIAMVQAIVSGVMFLGNMTPHGAYDLGPGIDFMRRQLAA